MGGGESGFEFEVMCEELGFGAFAFGNIFFDGNEVSNFVGWVTDRVNVNGLPIEGAVFAAVDEFAVPGFAGEDGLPEIDISFFRGFGGAEEVRFFSEEFFEGVACEGAEGWVSVNDFGGGVSDEDGGGALLDCGGEEAHLLFGAAFFGDVFDEGVSDTFAGWGGMREGLDADGDEGTVFMVIGFFEWAAAAGLVEGKEGGVVGWSELGRGDVPVGELEEFVVGVACGG